MEKYDYIIVGSGLFGCVFAREATKKGKKCLVIDKRNHIGGNIYTKKIEDIVVHEYGAHIFHTNNERVWNYVNNFAKFNRYTNSPIAIFDKEVYNMPFNMNTFHQLWNVITPEQAKQKIAEEIKECKVETPKNLEEQAICLVGKTIYEKLIKGYTEKQWGKQSKDLPAFIIKRLPVRFTYDNNYFNDHYQGIPIGGYTPMIENILKGVDIKLNYDFFQHQQEIMKCADKVVFTGMIDEYYNYIYGALEYRSLRFETEIIEMENYQGNAVINYTNRETPYTRSIEHKHFEFGTQPKTVITREYPEQWAREKEPYYPINDNKNNDIYLKYRALANKEKNIIFGGRLANYKYYDMDDVIEAALICADNELNKI